jgi:hypothetical protein
MIMPAVSPGLRDSVTLGLCVLIGRVAANSRRFVEASQLEWKSHEYWPRVSASDSRRTLKEFDLCGVLA